MAILDIREIPMRKQKISVYIITYNEEKMIKESLESIKFADEIILVDTYSSDDTLKICRNYTDKIFQIKFDGFGRLRKFALEYTSYDWILTIDADERVSEELKQEITHKLTYGFDKDVYFIPRKSFFLNHWVKHCGWYPDYHIPRLFNKNKMKYRESDLVHEGYILKPDTRIGYLKGNIIHYPFTSLEDVVNKTQIYTTLMAKQMFEYREVTKFHHLIFHPLLNFFKMYIIKAGFLDGKIGFLVSVFHSYYTFIKYSKLWELWQIHKKRIKF